MGDEVFDFLKSVECIRRSNCTYDFSIHDLSFEEFGVYANRVFRDKYRKCSRDVGDLMMDEFSARKGVLNSEQQGVMQEYFWADYSYCVSCAQDCLTAFENKVPLDVKEYPAYLGLVLIRRGGESLGNSRAFSKIFGSEELSEEDYVEGFSELGHYRRCCQLATEFPEHYWKITDLTSRMSRAAELEDYELAVLIRDEILKTTRFIHPEFPKVLKK